MPPNSCEVGMCVRLMEQRPRVFFYGKTAPCTLHMDQLTTVAEIMHKFSMGGGLVVRTNWGGWSGRLVESAPIYFDVDPSKYAVVWRGIFLPQINHVL